MGQIVKFPIFVIDDKATEAQFGITPQLRDSVRAYDNASTEAVVSEAGIRQTILDIQDLYTCAANKSTPGEFVPIFNSISSTHAISGITGWLSGETSGGVSGTITGDCGNYLTYNTLKGAGTINITSDDDNIFINSSTLTGVVEEITIIANRTINGGIEQEASKINYSDFNSITGVNSLSADAWPSDAIPAYLNAQVGDAIGKIMIKCTEEFDDETTYFSIGTLYDPEYYVKTFKAPNFLVSGGI